MKLVLVTFLILSFNFYSNGQDRFLINIPTVAEETEYIWRLIQDINFFEKHNYQVNLPKGKLIDTLKSKAKSNELGKGEFNALLKFMSDSIYSTLDYQAGYDKIKDQFELLHEMIQKIDQSGSTWNFSEFDQYHINLTLYGPGGSYNPDDGSLMLFTTSQGKFKNYENPANTIIHEIIHIGVEEAIVSKYNVPHAMKERMVDTYVMLTFGRHLPNYQIQDMGDHRIDKYLQKLSDLKTLDQLVEEAIKETQR